MSSGTIKIYVTVILILFIALFTLQKSADLDMFPHNDTYFEFSTSSDSSGSWAKYDSAHGHLHFRYKLDSSAAPRAQLLFHAHELARDINLKRYSDLQIKTDPEDNSDFEVVLYLNVPGFSDPKDLTTYRPYAFKCRADSTRFSFDLPLKDFATPLSWFISHNISEYDLPESDWSSMSHLAIRNFGGAVDSNEKCLAITSARFVSDPVQSALMAGATTFIGSLALSFFLKGIRKKRKTPFEKGDFSYSICSVDKNRLITYIHKNYNNPLFTLNLIEQELGLNHYVVNSIIRKEFDIGYKQYLNRIRMDEAKRLLTVTDKPIATIGEKVGYLYSNSFSRTFRSVVGVTPNEYRKNAKV